MPTRDLDLFELYFQRNSAYYLDKLEKYKLGKKYSFNLFPFLFGFFWFLYRKMYIQAFFFAVLIIAADYIQQMIGSDANGDPNIYINIFSTFLFATITGFIGNTLYVQQAERTIANAKTKFTDQAAIHKYVKQKGGVSYGFLILLALAIIFFFIMNNNP